MKMVEALVEKDSKDWGWDGIVPEVHGLANLARHDSKRLFAVVDTLE
jgi:hypothetical protein